MKFIKRFRLWFAYKRCLMKYDEALENIKNNLDGGSGYVKWSKVAIYYLDKALKIKEELDAQ